VSTRLAEPATFQGVTAWGALAVAVSMNGGIPLPEAVSAVQWRHGRAVALAGAPGVPVLVVLAPEEEARRIEVKPTVAGARRTEVIDFTADEQGTIHALVFESVPLGRDRRLLCRFGGQGEASCEELGERRCLRLAAAGPEAAWCYGEGPEGMLLHRVAGRQGPRFWLPAEGVLRTAGARRAAWLDSPSPGRLWLVLPEAGLLADVRLADGETRMAELPDKGRLTGAASFAAMGERLLALLPLGPAAGRERLDAPYGLFELRGAWRRIAADRQWLRGARLAGAGGGAAWVWDRAGRRLERVAVPPR
jgi:hypothetical protein